MLFCTPVFSGVTIEGTRIIFPAGSKSINVQLRNGFPTPSLVQSWIDNGDETKIPDASKIPFVLTPSLTRVEPRKGQIIRIIPTNTSSLPKDRESLFWFNMHDIPPDDPSLADKNRILFTVRTRIKLFYRPARLGMQPEDAYKKLSFKKINNSDVEIENNSPYFITILNIQNTAKNKTYTDSAILIEPFNKSRLSLKLDNKQSDYIYSILNDMGASREFTVSIK